MKVNLEATVKNTDIQQHKIKGKTNKQKPWNISRQQ